MEFQSPPFWQTKEKIRDKVLNERMIAVSVRRRELTPYDLAFVKDYRVGLSGELACRDLKKCSLMILSGGGLVKAPLQMVYKLASDYSQLPKMSENVHEARFDRKREQLFLHTSAFSFHARMLMKVGTQEGENVRSIHFRNLTGVVDGMIGVMQFESLNPWETRISIMAFYPYQDLKMPSFFLRTGLEIAMHRMATSIRSYVEKAYQMSLSQARQVPTGAPAQRGF